MASLDADSTFLFPLIFTLSVPARSVVINPFNQTMLLIPDADLAPDDHAKRGLPPASKDSIAALETFRIGEHGPDCEDVGDHCVICFEEWAAGDVARVMPCKHKFHGECIEKWLGVHGSCPVCRYEMPLEEEDGHGKKRGEGEEEEEEEEGRGRGSRVLVFSINFGGVFRGGVDENSTGSTGESRGDVDSSTVTATEQE
ncbi:hypothetical protein MLD38_024325 [Melastoma candidum]|uniref:Uncharacterized protein n=1 Tax=Melastoma candidum TaxID=119954 RepID=A0ACB9NRY1_9MYRT|nr:hypothetical protein MLD38_024325 [Melastoma candidum]